MGVNWLLLRGLVRERQHWADFPAQLAEACKGEVQTLDLPGVGTEAGRPAPTSIAAMVQDLRSRFSPGAGRWGIFAPSLGGMIALTWASLHPADFAKVAVCNTSARDLGSTFERFSPAALLTVARGLFTFNRTARERRVLALISNTERGRGHLNQFALLSRERPVGPRVLVNQLRAASALRAPASLSVPLLVLCSEGDRLCSPLCSRRLAQRLAAKLAVHPSAGHDLPLDDPDWVIARLTAFGLENDG